MAFSGRRTRAGVAGVRFAIMGHARLAQSRPHGQANIRACCSGGTTPTGRRIEAGTEASPYARWAVPRFVRGSISRPCDRTLYIQPQRVTQPMNTLMLQRLHFGAVLPIAHGIRSLRGPRRGRAGPGCHPTQPASVARLPNYTQGPGRTGTIGGSTATAVRLACPATQGTVTMNTANEWSTSPRLILPPRAQKKADSGVSHLRFVRTAKAERREMVVSVFG